MKLSPRQALSGLAAVGLLAGLAALLTRTGPEPLAAAPPAVGPLDRVPADAGMVVHLTAGNLWDHPAVADVRKAYAKEVDKVLEKVEKETGLRPEQIQSLTFHYPKFPAGPGDERLFVLQVVTKKPYNRDTVLGGFRLKGEKATGDVAKLEENMLLHYTSDTQFTVLHDTLLADFQKGPAKVNDGLMRDAIDAAKAGKNAFVFSIDPSGLPAEIFTSAPPELQPFLPLLKSKAILLQANLDKQLSLEVKFTADTEDQAIEAERSFNLLMKLADDAITTVVKEEKIPEDLQPLVPALTEIQKVVQQVKAERQGKVTTARAAIKADPALARPILALFLRPQMASARIRSQNNLKQIGLALHNYHDTFGALPPAAIVDKKGKPLLSWRVAILPYIEQDALYKQFKLDEPWDSEHNKKLAETVVPTYTLPYGESKPGTTHYRAFVGNGAAFEQVQGIKLTDFKDGTSNTLFVVEAAEGVPWAKPDDLEFDPQKPALKHLRFEKDACQVLFADGSVRSLSSKLKEDVLRLLIQRDDGMPIPDLD